MINELTDRIDRAERAEPCYFDIKEAFESINRRLVDQMVKAFVVDANVNNRREQSLKGRSLKV